MSENMPWHRCRNSPYQPNRLDEGLIKKIAAEKTASSASLNITGAGLFFIFLGR